MISAIMVTRGRPWRALKSAQMFNLQTWKDSELLVIADVRSEGWKELQGLVRDIPNVRFMAPPAVETYVELRNLGLAEAKGDIVCMWDDDDLNHPRRLEAQYYKMISDNAQACFFGNYIHFDEISKKIRWVRYPWGGLPGTMMCFSSANPRYNIGIGAETGIDTAMQIELTSRVTSTLISEGYLYVYVYHGDNAWDSIHHQRLASRLVSPSYVRDNFEVAQRHLFDMGLYVSSYKEMLW